MTGRTITSFRKLILIFLTGGLALIVISLPKDTWTLTQYWRTDNYPIYYSFIRILTIIMIMIVSILLLKRSCPITPSVLLPTNVFVYFLLFMIMPGVLLTSDFSYSGETSFYGYLTCFFLFTVGVVITSKVLRFDPKMEIAKFSSSNLFTYNCQNLTYQLFIALFILSLLIVCVTTNFKVNIFKEIYNFLVLGILSEGRIAEIRQEQYYEGSQSFLNSISSYCVVMFMPVSSMFVILNGMIRARKKEFIVGLIMMTISFAFLIISGSRKNALFVLLFIITAISCFRPLKMRKLVPFIISAIVFMIIQTLILGRMNYEHSSTANIVKSLNRSTERIFMGKGACSQVVFQYIPQYSDFKMGRTIPPSLFGRLSGEEIFAIEMFKFMTGGKLGTAGPQAFAEGYANFGIPGMLILAVLMGILIQSICVYIIRCNVNARNPRQIVFHSYLIILFAKIGYSDIMTFKSSGFHVLVFLMLIFYVFTRNSSGKLSAKYTSNQLLDAKNSYAKEMCYAMH